MFLLWLLFVFLVAFIAFSCVFLVTSGVTSSVCWTFYVYLRTLSLLTVINIRICSCSDGQDLASVFFGRLFFCFSRCLFFFFGGRRFICFFFFLPVSSSVTWSFFFLLMLLLSLGWSPHQLSSRSLTWSPHRSFFDRLFC